MIYITYKTNTFEMDIKGHAGHGKKGKDIVCSAVSCLFYTLGENLYENVDLLEEAPLMVDEDGSGYILSIPKDGCEEKVSLIYSVIANGMKMVADNYPKNVKFKVEE